MDSILVLSTRIDEEFINVDIYISVEFLCMYKQVLYKQELEKIYFLTEYEFFTDICLINSCLHKECMRILM